MNKFFPEQQFLSLFRQPIQFSFFCPGRINLIGEHIDYNGGWVMPCSIDMGTYLFLALNPDEVFRFHSLNFPASLEISVLSALTHKSKEWFNYPLGVLSYFLDSHQKRMGIDFLFYGNLPISSGLSSSASIEMVTAFALEHIFKSKLTLLDLVKLTKRVENEYIGVNSGIMDQFAVAFGKENSALFLNCSTLNYSLIPVELENYKLILIDTNKIRALSDSKYNERVLECNHALKLLKNKIDIDQLCQIEPDTLWRLKYLFPDPLIWNRARHVIEENERVKKASTCLQEGKLNDFGFLLYESHHSLMVLYEVSGKELDFIVHFCSSFAGVLGARMTGAGFGGCAIALVREDRIDEFSRELIFQYHSEIGYQPTIYLAHIGNGVREYFPE